MRRDREGKRDEWMSRSLRVEDMVPVCMNEENAGMIGARRKQNGW
jgi:hypothetical protein